MRRRPQREENAQGGKTGLHTPLPSAPVTWREEGPVHSSAPRPPLGHSRALTKWFPPDTSALHTGPAALHCSGSPLPAPIPGSCLILSVLSDPGGPASTLTPMGSGKPSPPAVPGEPSPLTLPCARDTGEKRACPTP